MHPNRIAYQPAKTIAGPLFPSASFQVVTPEIAQKWLEVHNYGNRAISERVVEKYARAMASGQWVQDGNSIAFDINGHLVNGQHRLSAIVASGVSVSLLIVRGVPVESFATTDTGAPRTGANVVTIAGKLNANLLTATTRMLLSLRDRAFFRQSFPSYSPMELLHAINAVPQIEHFVQLVPGRFNALRKLLPQTTIAVSLLITFELNPAMAETFWNAFATGIGLNDGSPVAALRARCIADSTKTKIKTYRYFWLSLVFSAWRAYTRGESLSRLHVMNPEAAFKDSGGYAVIDNLGLPVTSQGAETTTPKGNA